MVRQKESITFEVGSKVCKGCERDLPLDHYYTERRNNDGRKGKCRHCISIYHKRRYQAKRHDYMAEYRDAHKKEIREYLREWYVANKEKHKEVSKQYRQENHEKVSQYNRRYREANAEEIRHKQKSIAGKRRMYEQNRRARKAAQLGELDEATIELMYLHQDGLCAYCEYPLLALYQVDHIVPLSKGGKHDWSNIAIVCRRCNNSKYTTDVEAFMVRLRERGRVSW